MTIFLTIWSVLGLIGFRQITRGLNPAQDLAHIKKYRAKYILVTIASGPVLWLIFLIARLEIWLNSDDDLDPPTDGGPA